MTLLRQVVPGCDYLITRRCSERRFFLRPDDDTNNAFIYCLALAAMRANVQVTFSTAMSNHHHTGIHDLDGNFPIFNPPSEGPFHATFSKHIRPLTPIPLRGSFSRNFFQAYPTSYA
jgi:hypothetical protein